MNVVIESLDDNSLPMQLSMAKPVGRAWYLELVQSNPDQPPGFVLELERIWNPPI